MQNACVILIPHVKCMGYFNSPCKMYHLILTPKTRHSRHSMILSRCWRSMSGLKSERAVYFLADVLCLLRCPDKPQPWRDSCRRLLPRFVLGSFVVVLMSCKVYFHVIRSALRNSICLLLCTLYKFGGIRSSNRSYFLRQIRLRSFCSSCLI